MVAGRGGDHSLLALLGSEQAHLVAGTTELERARVLKVFAFQVQLAATERRQSGAMAQWCDRHCGTQGIMGLLDVGKQSWKKISVEGHHGFPVLDVRWALSEAI
ncbi:hypothetical protein D3C76_1454200 [compost metagenome]